MGSQALRVAAAIAVVEQLVERLEVRLRARLDEFQRLRLDPPLSGTLGPTSVTILEIGVLGARVSHAQPIASEYEELRFAYDNAAINPRPSKKPPAAITGSSPTVSTTCGSNSVVGTEPV